MKNSRFVWCCVALALDAGVSSRGQQPPPRDLQVAASPAAGTSSITGVVTTDETPARPLRMASVTLTPVDGARSAAQLTATDAAGKFAFSALPAGRYTVSVTKAPYVATSYGSRRPGGPGTPIAVAAAQTLAIALKMMRGAVIAGRVTGYMSGIGGFNRVQLMQWRTSGGDRSLVNTGSGQSLLDGNLSYRFFGLAPGEYVVMFTPRGGPPSETELRRVSAGELQWAERQFQNAGSSGAPGAPPAMPPRGQPIGLAPVYYPGTTDSSAAVTIKLGPGEERSDIDFGVAFVPTATIAGQVVAPDGRPPGTVQANLISLGDLSSGSSFLRPTPDGRFTTSGVAPGRYVLVVRAAEAPSPGTPATPAPGRGGAAQTALPLWASEELNVNGQDILGLTVRLQPGLVVSGRVAFDASTRTAPTDFTQVRISLATAPSKTTVTVGVPAVAGNADGTFVVPGVAPGNYRLTATLPTAAAAEDWMVKSSIVSGADALDIPMTVKAGANIDGAVVTFTDRVSELSGTLIDSSGRPATEYFIVAFSTDQRMWQQGSRRVRQVRPGTNGGYRFATLPAGEYYVSALTDLEPNQAFDDAFLAQLVTSSVKVVVGEGERKVKDFRIGG